MIIIIMFLFVKLLYQAQACFTVSIWNWKIAEEEKMSLNFSIVSLILYGDAANVTIDNCAVCCYTEKQLINCIVIGAKHVLINVK